MNNNEKAIALGLSDRKVSLLVDSIQNGVQNKKSLSHDARTMLKSVTEQLEVVFMYTPEKLINYDKTMLHKAFIIMYDEKVFRHYIKLCKHGKNEMNEHASTNQDYMNYIQGRSILFKRDFYRYIAYSAISRINEILSNPEIHVDKSIFLKRMEEYLLKLIESGGNELIEEELQVSSPYNPINSTTDYGNLNLKINISDFGNIDVITFTRKVWKEILENTIKYCEKTQKPRSHIATFIEESGALDMCQGIDPESLHIDKAKYELLCESLAHDYGDRQRIKILKNDFISLYKSILKQSFNLKSPSFISKCNKICIELDRLQAPYQCVGMSNEFIDCLSQDQDIEIKNSALLGILNSEGGFRS